MIFLCGRVFFYIVIEFDYIMIIKILNLYNCLNMNKTSILVCLYLDNYTNKWLVTNLLFIKPFRFKKT